MAKKNNATLHRESIKAEFWADEIAWTGEPPEKGWFRAPRTLPLVLTLLSSKKVTGSKFDPTSVYLELLARHRDTGIVEMATEGEHSYAAGYSGPRGVRTWQERMKILLDLGFIKSMKSGNQQYKYVLLVHPNIVVKKLLDQGKIDKSWWDTYRARQIETKELTYAQLISTEEVSEAVLQTDETNPKGKKAS